MNTTVLNLKDSAMCKEISSKKNEIKHRINKSKTEEAWRFYLDHMNESLEAIEFNYLYYKKHAKRIEGYSINPRTDYHLELYQR